MALIARGIGNIEKAVYRLIQAGYTEKQARRIVDEAREDIDYYESKLKEGKARNARGGFSGKVEEFNVDKSGKQEKVSTKYLYRGQTIATINKQGASYSGRPDAREYYFTFEGEGKAGSAQITPQGYRETFVESSGYLQAKTNEPNYYGAEAIRAVPEPKGVLERTRIKISESASKGGFRETAAGLAAPIVDTGIFIKYAFISPVETTKNIFKGGYETGRKIVSGEGFPELGQLIYERPRYATGYVASAVITSVVGTKGLNFATRTASRIAPATYETRFIAQEAGSVGENIYFKSGAVTTRKTLLSSRSFASAGLSQARFYVVDEGRLLFKSATATATRETARDIVTGRPLFRKPFGSVSAEVGQVKPADLNLRLGGNNLFQASKPIEQGFEVISTGKGRLIDKPKTEFYRTLAYGGDLYEGTQFLISKSKSVSRKTGNFISGDTGFSLGLYKRGANSEPTSFVRTSGVQRTSLAKTFGGLQTTEAVKRAIESNIKVGQSKSLFKSPPAIFKLDAQETSVVSRSIYYGRGQYERTEQVSSQVTFSFQRETTIQNQPIALRLSSSLAQSSSLKQVLAFQPLFSFATKSESGLAQLSRGVQLQRNAFRQPQLFRLAQAPRAPSIPNVPRFPAGATRAFILIRGNFNLDSLGGRSYRGGQATRYIPSFTALAFKISGAYRAGKLSKSGLDFRPITSGFSINTNNFMRIIRRRR